MSDEENQFRPFPGFATDLIHKGQDPDQWKCRAVIPPIVTSTTFQQIEPDEDLEFSYGRKGNPTRQSLETCLAASEQAKYALTFSSGLGAISALVNLLKTGQHVVSMDDIYGGAFRLFDKCAVNMGIETTFVDCQQPENVIKALRENTRMIWMETPTNPLMKILDLSALVEAVRAETKDWEVKPFIVVDNTFMTPYFQRPLEFGVDIVMHSVTKYINGHSDVMMGAVMLNDQALYERLQFIQFALGPVPSSFDCYLVNRGMKTLAVRMKQHMKNGLEIAKFLEGHPAVEKVFHPGLRSHPQYELANRQMRGHTGMFSFYIKGGLEESRAFLKNLKYFSLAKSLGGYESLVELPSKQSHASIPEHRRQQFGITDNLIRLSVGIEDVQDLITALDDALRIAVSS